MASGHYLSFIDQWYRPTGSDSRYEPGKHSRKGVSMTLLIAFFEEKVSAPLIKPTITGSGMKSRRHFQSDWDRGNGAGQRKPRPEENVSDPFY
jgi:hypothetical protein